MKYQYKVVKTGEVMTGEGLLLAYEAEGGHAENFPEVLMANIEMGAVEVIQL